MKTTALFTALISLAASTALAVPALADNTANDLPAKLMAVTPYRSGEQICGGDPRPFGLSSTDERGVFIEVPIDYQKPERGNTKIYAWTNGPFDANKDSLVYFVGGPGGSSHGFIRLNVIAPTFNVIHFDQRGSGCSHPADPQLLTDTSYFSSEATARDADAIRRHFQIERWSVYGHSYGTVPATIHAHLYATTSKALVLEGTVVSGDEKLWSAPHRVKILNRYFAKLPENLRELVLKLSQDPAVPPFWFSGFAQLAMYRNFALKNLTETLEGLSFAEPATQRNRINETMNLAWQKQDTEFGFAAYTYAMLACKELSGSDPDSSFFASFENGKLVPIASDDLQSSCKQLGITSSGTYLAKNYPVTIPVTYFQGGLDGASEAPGAIRHFKTVAQGPAQILIAPQGGHTPIQFAQRDFSSIQSIVLAALNGQKIDADALKKANDTNDYKIVIAQRRF